MLTSNTYVVDLHVQRHVSGETISVKKTSIDAVIRFSLIDWNRIFSSSLFCGLLSGDVTRMLYWFLNHIPITFRRLESRDKYTRSKSPNIFNRKTIEISTPAAPKSGASEPPKPQRARTASMPGENRKVRGRKKVDLRCQSRSNYSFNFIINWWSASQSMNWNYLPQSWSW